MVWQSYQVSQAQPICVDNIDAQSWITGWKDTQNSFKGLQGILFFSILQTIWISLSQSYNWSGSQLHNPTNHLDTTFTRPCNQHIYEIWESKQHMNLNVHKPTLLNFLLNWELQLQILRAWTTGTFCFQMYKTMVIHCLSITYMFICYYMQNFTSLVGFFLHHIQVYIIHNYWILLEGHAHSRTCTEIIYNIQYQDPKVFSLHNGT